MGNLYPLVICYSLLLENGPIFYDFTCFKMFLFSTSRTLCARLPKRRHWNDEQWGVFSIPGFQVQLALVKINLSRYYLDIYLHISDQFHSSKYCILVLPKPGCSRLKTRPLGWSLVIISIPESQLSWQVILKYGGFSIVMGVPPSGSWIPSQLFQWDDLWGQSNWDVLNQARFDFQSPLWA